MFRELILCSLVYKEGDDEWVKNLLGMLVGFETHAIVETGFIFSKPHAPKIRV
jgi:hypothetical protein